MLASQKWEHLGKMWDDEKRKKVNLVWHKLEGTRRKPEVAYRSLTLGIGWPDSSDGLHALKQQAIIGTLSNGNVRLLADMVCRNMVASIRAHSHFIPRQSTRTFPGTSSSQASSWVRTNRKPFSQQQSS